MKLDSRDWITFSVMVLILWATLGPLAIAASITAGEVCPPYKYVWSYSSSGEQRFESNSAVCGDVAGALAKTSNEVYPLYSAWMPTGTCSTSTIVTGSTINLTYAGAGGGSVTRTVSLICTPSAKNYDLSVSGAASIAMVAFLLWGLAFGFRAVARVGTTQHD